jgi:hypothetical protein
MWHAAGMVRLTQHRANRSNPCTVMVGPWDYILSGCFAGRLSTVSKVDIEPMMMRFAVATAAVLPGCGSASAQARPALGMTSPLGIPNARVPNWEAQA